jgi:hypothetical protein
VPSNYESFRTEPEPESAESASRDPEAVPSGYEPVSQARAYPRNEGEPGNLPDHGLLLDNEPGPSGLNQSRNSPVEESAPSGYQNDPGPSNYGGQVSMFLIFHVYVEKSLFAAVKVIFISDISSVSYNI